MILELLSVNRLTRELNQVLRKLSRGNPDVYIISLKGQRVAYLVAPDLFQAGMHTVDHVALDETLRKMRTSPQENQSKSL